MKQIQEWLGHSDFGTTANIYTHLDQEHKKKSMNKLDEYLQKSASDQKDASNMQV